LEAKLTKIWETDDLPGGPPSLKPKAIKSFAGPSPLPLKTNLLADPHVLGSGWAMGRENKKGRNTMMKEKQLILRAARKYLILQLPGVVLLVIALILIRRWVDLPAWLFWGLIVMWVGKDVVMFPFVRKAYEPQDDANPMIGSLGVVEKRLSPSGFVRIRGELWKAHVPDGSMPIDRGETIRVSAIEGMTLVVERAAERPGQE